VSLNQDGHPPPQLKRASEESIAGAERILRLDDAADGPRTTHLDFNRTLVGGFGMGASDMVTMDPRSAPPAPNTEPYT